MIALILLWRFIILLFVSFERIVVRLGLAVEQIIVVFILKSAALVSVFFFAWHTNNEWMTCIFAAGRQCISPSPNHDCSVSKQPVFSC